MTKTVTIDGEEYERVSMRSSDREAGCIELHIRPLRKKASLQEEVAIERAALGFHVSQYQMEDWSAVLYALCRVLDRRLAELEGKINHGGL